MHFHYILDATDVTMKKENALYSFANVHFMKVFGDIRRDPNLMRECYLCRDIVLEEELLAIEGVEELHAKKLIGANEADILSFITSYRSYPICSVVASIGSGKSTLLHNIRTRVVPALESIHAKLHLVFVDFDIHGAKLNTPKASADPDFTSAYLENIIADDIFQFASEWLSLTNAEFWEFVYRDVKTFWGHVDGVSTRKELATNRTKPGTPERTIHEEFMHSRSGAFALMRYLGAELKKDVVIIVDNIDPLPRPVQEQVLGLADRLFEEAGVRTIVAFRDTTFYYIKRKNPHRQQVISPLIPPTYRDLFEMRVACFKRKVDLGGRERKETVYRQLNMTADEAEEILDTMVDILLQDDTTARLKKCSNGDLKLAMRMLNTYFRSGYFHSEMLTRVRGYVADRGTEPHVPAHLFTQSIVTKNHTSFAPEKDRHIAIINVWFTDALPTPWAYFIKLQILQMFKRYQSLPVSNARELIRTAYACNNEVAQRIDTVVTELFREAINARLLETPEFLDISAGKELDEKLMLNLSSAGKYYAESMAYLLEYLSYAKDVCGYTIENPGIEPATTAPCLWQRFGNVLRFIEYMFAHEEALIREIHGKEGWRTFIDHLLPEEIGNRHLHTYMALAEASRVQKAHFTEIRSKDVKHLQSMIARVVELETELLSA